MPDIVKDEDVSETVHLPKGSQSGAVLFRLERDRETPAGSLLKRRFCFKSLEWGLRVWPWVSLILLACGPHFEWPG